MEVTTVFSLLGGLGLFLFGIKTMGDGLEQAAGSKMKRLLEALTRNKLTAVLVGLLVTAVIQSSSATTVMGGGFCQRWTAVPEQGHRGSHGRQYRHHRDLPVLSVKLNFGVLFTAVGAICQLAGNRSSFKLFGQIMMGLGILFVGMDAMTAGHGTPAGVAGLPRYDGMGQEPICGRAGGRGRNGASAEQLGQRGHLAGTGSHGGDQPAGVAVYPLRPEHRNRVTALLASVGANRTAKRAAVVHLLFNIIGATLFIIIVLALPLASWIEMLAGANLRLRSPLRTSSSTW